MAEKLDLATPITTPTLATYRVDELHLKWSAERIDIRLLGTNGESRWESYSGPAAVILMAALNKANLTTNSLHRRILNRLVTDGKLTGTISGTPD